MEDHPTANWSKEDYLAFVCLYAANADSNISEEELELIFEKSGAAAYRAVRPEFDQLSDFERAALIMEGKELHFPGPEGKTEVLSHLQEVFDADGKFTQAERMYKLSIGKLL